MAIADASAYHRRMSDSPTPGSSDSAEPAPPPTSENSGTTPTGAQLNDAERAGVSAFQVLQSTLAAAFGVQSSRNRERDFKQGKASQFIIAGIVFTLAFIGVMVLIVRTVLGATGS